LKNFNIKDDTTTDTELNAMAADPIQGWSLNPQGAKTPAAIGIPAML